MASLTSTRIFGPHSLLKPPKALILRNSLVSSSNKLQLRTCNNVESPSCVNLLTTSHKLGVSLRVKSQLKFNGPMISPEDHWGLWSLLFSLGACGLWLEKTKIGSMISSALVSILIGLAASNMRIIPFEAPTYSIVGEYLLPFTLPLLLFRANMCQLIQSTGKLLLVFLLGSVATVIGTVVALYIVPMRSLGSDNWKIAAALMGSYIGGSVNYIAISKVLGISPSNLAAGLAADNVICAIHFMVIFAIASRALPKETKPTTVFITKLFGIRGGATPLATTIVVALATAFPKVFNYLAPSAEVISLVLMQVFFIVIGASSNIWSAINTAPSIFLFAFVQVIVHLAVILGLGKLFHFDLKLLLLASNANIGGHTAAIGLATANGWDSLIISVILASIFGVSIATFVGIGVGITILKHM